ncbi:9144_t:CDS:2 [Ambispora gerdemannii]|uniref:9144_t:CDS:1 n=1 Tax=Ambispora gerdemannii TaxID=144530 RepID=A0A9N8V234_9GLOM|nr:9144_t:CDS:2 [Ambispora gerdemannii]
MIFDKELAKLSLPLELVLFPGENLEFVTKTNAIKLFEATTDGGFAEYGGKPYENYSLIDVETEVRINRCDNQLSNVLSTYKDFFDSQFISIIFAKFDMSSKYLFKFSKPKPSAASGNFINIRSTAISLCEEFTTILRRFACPSSVENVFAFKMGEEVIRQTSNKVTEVRNVITKESKCRKFEEQIFDELFGENSSSDETDDEVESKGIDESVYKRSQILGWSKGYRIQKEFERMSMNLESWCIASVNDDFTLSPTYPQDFILPSKILKTSSVDSDSSQSPSYPGTSVASQPTSIFFRNLARFRSRARFPVICWKKGLHVLMRSGQPMTGFLGSRGFEDELLIREVIRAVNDEQSNIIAASKLNSQEKGKIPYGQIPKMSGKQCNSKVSMKICILDARGYAAALSNGCGGGGYENAENYPTNTSLSFLGLSNIHAISSSHDALLRAISANSTSSNWYSGLESTGWFTHVTELLKAAGGPDGVIGKIIDEDASVLVHCTDGWDRTTQLVSLAQIMLDPFYRTIKGLQVLIEKEWIAFGHPFRARGDLPNTLLSSDPRKHNSNNSSSGIGIQEPANIQSAPAPVFLLFLTCVHLIVKQFPSAFEYNDFLLLCLARAGAGNSPFGDFLCNSECERDYLRLRERTTSIWGWVKERKQWFRNAGYQRPRKEDKTRYHKDGTINHNSWKKMVLRPDTDARMITLWTEYYFPKDDFSIPLLCTPIGADFIVPPEMNMPVHHSYQVGGLPSEYYFVSLFVKRRRQRIIKKAWCAWRNLVLEKKRKRQQQLNHIALDDQARKCEKKSKILRQEDKDDKWDIEEMVMAGEEGDGNNETDSRPSKLPCNMKEIDDSRVFLVVKTSADKNNGLVGGGVRPQRKSSTDSTSTLSTSGRRSQSSNSENSSLSDDYDDYDNHQENKERALIFGGDAEQYETNFAVRELYDSHLHEWLELSRQSDDDITPEINGLNDDDIADLLREAQMDSDNSLGGVNKNTIEELLMEAQTDTSPVMNIRSHDIDSTTKMTLCLDGIHDSNCNHNTICNTFNKHNSTAINKRSSPLSSTTNTTKVTDLKTNTTTTTSKLFPNSSLKPTLPSSRKYVDVSEFSSGFERPIKKSSSRSGVNLSTRNSMQDLCEFVFVEKV